MDIWEMDIWEKAVAFHGHTCGGLALGVRAAMEARKRFDVERAADEEIVCVTENDACGVDGVQSALGCTLGKGNLIYRNTGKFAFSFFNRSTGDSFRLMARDKPEGLHGDAYIEHVLTGPLEEIFSVGAPRVSLPEPARSLSSVKCELCGEAAPETKIRLQDGRRVCLDCYKDYDRGWK